MKKVILITGGSSGIGKAIGEFLLDNDVYIVFNMMCDPGRWKLVQEMHQQLTPRIRVLVNAKILSDHSGGDLDGQPWEYLPEQIEYIKNIIVSEEFPERRFPNVNLSSMLVYNDGTMSKLQNPFELVNNTQHNFKGWECSAGNEGISIGFDGYAFAGVCHSRLLGRIDTFKLSANPVVCPRQWCKCGADILLSKRNLHDARIGKI